MSTSSSSSGHSRYASTSSTSSLGSFSDIHPHSSFQNSQHHQDSYPQAQSHRHNANFTSTNSFDFGSHDRLSSQYQHPSSRQDMQLLQNENALLQQRILVLEAEKSTLQTNFNSLLSSISMSKPPPAVVLPSSLRERPTSSSSAVPNVLPPPPFVLYTEKEVPNATFWQQKVWNTKIEKDVGREATSGNPLATKNSLHFITDEDGAYPTPERITEARAICASFYFGLKKAGTLPDTWTQVTIADKQIFRATIESEIPELRYCAGHWKVDRLGRITYASWSGTHYPKGSRVKTEPMSDVEMDAGSDDSDDSDEGTGSKRKTNSRARTLPPPAKKLKSKASRSTSASAPDRKGKAKVVQAQRPKNPLFGRTPTPSFSPALDSTLPPIPMPPPALESALGPTPTPTLDSTVGPTPTPAPVSTTAPSSAPALDSALGPTPTPAPASTAAPPSVPTLESALGPTPTPALDSTAAPTPTPAPASTTAPSSAPALDSALGPTPTPAPASTAAPSSAPALDSALRPTPTPALNSTAAPTPTPVPASTTAPSSVPPPPISTATEKKIRAWNPLATSTTAKGMCGYAYKKQNPNASKVEFETYFAGLPSDKKKFWRDEEKKAKIVKAAAASTTPASVS